MFQFSLIREGWPLKGTCLGTGSFLEEEGFEDTGTEKKAGIKG